MVLEMLSFQFNQIIVNVLRKLGWQERAIKHDSAKHCDSCCRQVMSEKINARSHSPLFYNPFSAI